MILIKLLTIGALCAMTTGTPATADMLTDKTSAALKADALSDKTDTYVKAGLKDRFEGKTGAEWLLSFTTDAMYASAKACALDFKPGERFQYSDQGYFLLGMIIEKVGGRCDQHLESDRTNLCAGNKLAGGQAEPRSRS